MPAEFGLLGSEFFTNIVLPFILVFTISFSVLQKTKLFDEKKDISVIIALVMSLITVGVPAAIGVLNNLIPVIAVLVMIFFAWFLVFGFVGTRVGDKDEKGKELWSGTTKRLFGVVTGLILFAIIAWSVGIFDYITLDSAKSAQIIQMVLLVGAIITVISVVVSSEHAREEDGGRPSG